jgi:F-type H+-transporting ATPase subunit b
MMIFFGFAENSIQLVPDGTLFLHIAIILLMIFILNATLFRPINRILEARENRTRGHASKAREILHRVEEKISNYERSLREARAEAYRLVEQERHEEMNERQAKLNAVREEVASAIVEQKSAIEEQTAEARQTLARDARRIATQIGARVLHRPVSEDVITNFDSRF